MKIRALVAAAATSLAVAAPAQAAIFLFPQTYQLQGSATNVLHGVKDQATGDCEFPEVILDLESWETVKELRQLSLNSLNCEAQYEVGIPPAQYANGPALREGGTDEDADPGSALTAPLDALTESYTFSAGYLTSWWEDPVNIDVNKVVNGVKFYHGGGCVHNPYKRNSHGDWYGTSGWSLESWNFLVNANCGSVSGSTYAKYNNGSFCGGQDVQTYYNRNLIMGYPSGRLQARARTYNKGATCKHWLDFHFQLRRTAP